MANHERLSDEEMLDVLDRHANGQTAAQIAKTMKMTRSAVLGILFRARAPDASVKPENQDGGMPRGWHLKGLANRKARRK